MANPEHLKRLLRGVEDWNEWRHRHPHVGVDLQEADLQGQELVVVDLRGANLQKVNLEGADLRKADLGSGFSCFEFSHLKVWAPSLSESHA